MSSDTLVVSKNVKEYRCRKPQYSSYYQCIEDNYEMFERVYERKYQEKYGFLRPIVSKVIYQYLDCGILHNGFARVKCRVCKHEYLLAFSCKRRHFCPSCHAKRVAAFGEFACLQVLKNVPHRHFVFSIPKIIRIYFLFDRALLKELSKIAWEVLGLYYKNSVSKENITPAAISSIQTFGEFLGFNPHLHMLCADGCFGVNGIFYAAGPDINAGSLEPLFRHKILSMLKKKRKITEATIKLILSWHHSGFNVYCTERIYPRETKSMENLARYIIRASFSQDRLNYIREDSKVIYKSKKESETKEFDAIDFIASICSHIPNKNEQMVRYTGYYSNVCRGRRKRQGTCESDFVVEEDGYKSANKSWARLIKKIYEVDPLICPICKGQMRIIAFIEDYKVVKKILDYLGIYEFKRDRPPPKTLAVADSFDDYGRNDYIDYDYVDF
ncbi:MAG: transposase [Actinobacteria bacterium]|nr:transposase [Actinomycetota bacterium]